MKTISGKSSSLMRPSPLSSSRLITIGVVATCADQPNGLSLATGSATLSPPQRNSSCGNTSSNGVGGSVQVGSSPVPAQAPVSQTVNGGQSQSSSQVQPIGPPAASLHSLSK